MVTLAGRDIRRRVGPQAWVLLEELVFRAGDAGQGTAAVDVTLATLVESLGLSADVIRAAIRRLIDAAIIERQERRTAGSQRFATTRYLLVGDTGLTTLAEPTGAGTAKPDRDTPHTEKPHAARPVRQDPRDAGTFDAAPQLSLLDLPSSPSATRGARKRHA